jgi:hypothetical protein
MYITSRLISCATLLALALMVANAEMIVRTKDGRMFKVQVESSDIESISFTGSGSGSGAAILRPESLPFGSSSNAGNLGRVWRIREVSGGTVYEGVWTRRGTSNAFDGVWPSAGVKDALTLESVNGDQVVFSRPGTGRYTGTLSPDHRRITSGTMSWAPGYRWSATIE